MYFNGDLIKCMFKLIVGHLLHRAVTVNMSICLYGILVNIIFDYIYRP